MQVNLQGNVTDESALSSIIRGTLDGHEDQQNVYGVFFNEMKDLVDEEDIFDCAEDNGPDPPILETCTEPVVCGQLDLPDIEPLDVLNLSYNQFRPGYTIVLYGPRRSGKTKLLKNICQRMRPYFSDVICFTKTKDSGEYFDILPYNRIIEGLDEELLLDVLMMQARRKRAQTRGEILNNYHILIILDDCMAQKLRYKEIFNTCFYNGRHYNITLIVTVQDVKGIAPAATINADLALTFSLPDRRGRDTIREKFSDYFTRQQFDAIYDSPFINKKYHIVCFDIAHRYNPINRRISFGCVDEKMEEKYVLGSRETWKGSEKQLVALGFEYLLLTDDWGIVQPKKK